MELKTLLYEKEAGIGIITLNRPKTLNALNDELIGELSMLLDVIAADPEVQAVIITGGEKAFAAGGDILFMSTADTLQAEKFVESVRTAFDKIYQLDKPVIAAISGLALGGGSELALACDIRIAAEGSKIGQPEINLGIIPGAGGTQRLTRVVGPGWAKYLVMTGLPIDAETALKIGLVTAVVPKDQLMDEAKKLAGIMIAKSPVAMKAAKQCLNLSLDVDLAAGLSYELKTWSALFATEDQKEGMKAFLEKRQPVYKGR
ncbi:MAG: enoyl-CoA hydratase/isomerase family protein [Syntrophomonadaceae bacterium]|jgi:enoyl-CoA hydratase|nr:enoyl-CoA hydratase/isomerase family protein [Syntrophomonadaceae bacterium]